MEPLRKDFNEKESARYMKELLLELMIESGEAVSVSSLRETIQAMIDELETVEETGFSSGEEDSERENKNGTVIEEF